MTQFRKWRVNTSFAFGEKVPESAGHLSTATYMQQRAAENDGGSPKQINTWNTPTAATAVERFRWTTSWCCLLDAAGQSHALSWAPVSTRVSEPLKPPLQQARCCMIERAWVIGALTNPPHHSLTNNAPANPPNARLTRATRVLSVSQDWLPRSAEVRYPWDQALHTHLPRRQSMHGWHRHFQPAVRLPPHAAQERPRCGAGAWKPPCLQKASLPHLGRTRAANLASVFLFVTNFDPRTTPYWTLNPLNPTPPRRTWSWTRGHAAGCLAAR